MESKKVFPDTGIISPIPPDQQKFGTTHRGSVTVACPDCLELHDFWLNGKLGRASTGSMSASS